MIAAPALVRGRAVHLLDFDASEHPVAIQFGGADPAELAQAARMAAERGYDEVNLNVGCPSDRVKSGCFGAVLMQEPALVAECVAAMIRAQDVEVTVKCRIGVDDLDPRRCLPEFLARIRDAGVRRVAIHARAAWLKGLSPKENREIPPLDYRLVQDMKRMFPDLHISLNGGIASLDDAQALLASGLDGVMIGRAAYHRPADVLMDADRRIFGMPNPSTDRHAAALAMIPYIERWCASGGRPHAVTRHMLGLFAGQPGARAWRRHLSEQSGNPKAGAQVVLDALDLVSTPHAAACL